MRQLHTNTEPRRAGFTLVELLVVIAIVAVIGALGAGAYLKVKDAQEKSLTETTLKKLASALDLQWKAVLDQSREDWQALPEDIKSNLRKLATGTAPGVDPRLEDRARLLYTKFRLQQEFPVSFQKAVIPGGPGAKADQRYLPETKTVRAQRFNGKRAYVDQLTDANGAIVPLNKDLESSICLYLALTQTRRGVSGMNPVEAVGSAFVRTVSGTVNGQPRMYSYFVDAFGNPLQFYIFPTAATITTLDLNRGAEKDPQDPEGLLSPPWQANLTDAQLVPLLLHKLPSQLPTQRKLVPVIVSPGSDGKLGGAFPPQDSTMNLTSEDANDNIYSHRLRQTDARGD